MRLFLAWVLALLAAVVIFALADMLHGINPDISEMVLMGVTIIAVDAVYHAVSGK